MNLNAPREILKNALAIGYVLYRTGEEGLTASKSASIILSSLLLAVLLGVTALAFFGSLLCQGLAINQTAFFERFLIATTVGGTVGPVAGYLRATVATQLDLSRPSEISFAS
jgi:hypothetical protein